MAKFDLILIYTYESAMRSQRYLRSFAQYL